MVEGRDVKSGICYQDSKLVCGLLEEQGFCDEGTWEPPFIVAHADHQSRTCAYYPYKVLIGRCGPNADGTPGICSNSASRCEDPTAFVVRDSTCSITHDSLVTTDGEESKVKWPGAGPNPGGSSPFSRWTTYGSCNGRCVWSPNDCVEGEAYANNDPACTADKVSIGGCVDGYAYCVVSEENCKASNGEEEPYYSHQKLLDELDVDCYLSTLPKLVTPLAPSPRPTPNPTVSSTSSPTSSTSTDSNSASAYVPVDALESKGSELSTGAIIGICVGSAALAFIVTLGIHMHIQRKRKLQDWQAGKEEPHPTKSITIDDVGVASASDAEEAVSVLE